MCLLSMKDVPGTVSVLIFYLLCVRFYESYVNGNMVINVYKIYLKVTDSIIEEIPIKYESIM